MTPSSNDSVARRLLLNSSRMTGTAVLVALFLAVLPRLDVLALGLVPIAQALAPVLCLVAVLLSLVMMFFRRGRVPAVVLLCGAIAGGIPLLVPSGASGETDLVPLAVLSINVEVGGADIAALSAVIEEHQVDVAVLVEADEYLIKSLLSPELEKLLPHRSGTVSSGGTAGTVILSKYPLQEEPGIHVPAGVTSFDQPVVKVEHPQMGTIRVAGVHPFPPIRGATEWKKSLESINTWQSKNTDLPLVMAGDFNASYAHPVFREIASSFTDAAAASGILPVPTWPSTGIFPAFTAIDHVLVRDLTATKWERATVGNTDHFGVVAKISKIER